MSLADGTAGPAPRVHALGDAALLVELPPPATLAVQRSAVADRSSGCTTSSHSAPVGAACRGVSVYAYQRSL